MQGLERQWLLVVLMMRRMRMVNKKMQSLQMTAVKVSFHIIMLKVDNVITYTMPYANHHHDVT